MKIHHARRPGAEHHHTLAAEIVAGKRTLGGSVGQIATEPNSCGGHGTETITTRPSSLGLAGLERM
jgi:hypothetical protein